MPLKTALARGMLCLGGIELPIGLCVDFQRWGYRPQADGERAPFDASSVTYYGVTLGFGGVVVGQD